MKGDGWDKKILEHFLDVKQGIRFQKIVASVRKSVGLPLEGIHPYTEWKPKTKMGSREVATKIASGVKKIHKVLNLDEHMADITERYVKYGEHFEKGFVPETTQTIHCYIKYLGTDVLIGIRPGATENEVRNFLHEHWTDIRLEFHVLKDEHPEKFRRIKKRTMRARDEKIIELYRQRIITSTGMLNVKKAPEYFARYGINPPYDRRSLTAILGFQVPNPDSIKKIIERHGRLLKQ